MQIQPLFLTLGSLLNGRLFRIPQYQRAYSWGTKQRRDLFDDIDKVFEGGEEASSFRGGNCRYAQKYSSYRC